MNRILLFLSLCLCSVPVFAHGDHSGFSALGGAVFAAAIAGLLLTQHWRDRRATRRGQRRRSNSDRKHG